MKEIMYSNSYREQKAILKKEKEKKKNKIGPFAIFDKRSDFVIQAKR